MRTTFLRAFQFFLSRFESRQEDAVGEEQDVRAAVVIKRSNPWLGAMDCVAFFVESRAAKRLISFLKLRLGLCG